MTMYIRYYFSALLGCILGVTVYIIFPVKVTLDEVRDKYICRLFEIINSPSLFKPYTEESLASSVWCIDKETNTKFCHFKNLYHIPSYKNYIIFLMNEFSVVSGVETVEILKHFSLSSVSNHTGLNLKLLMIKTSEYILQQTIFQLDKESFLLHRFKPDNIMHVIHDDLLPLYFTYKELCIGDLNLCLEKYQLIFLDSNDEGPHFEWYSIFSNHKPIFLSRERVALRIKSCMVGISKKSVWFQYGFKTVQGPVHNLVFNRYDLKQFTKFIQNKFQKPKSTTSKNESKSHISNTFVFLNRKINRKILNELEVENNIKQIYKKVYNKSLNIASLDLSTNSTKSIISAIQKTNFLIGMHGSAMILAIFLPPGSTIIELFPYGIQPEAVSPLKALCSLANMSLNYFQWVNSNEDNTVTHPEYPALLGGISHLQSSDQEKIRSIKLVTPVFCCHNPVYLFRMFQDTNVDQTFFDLFLSILSETNFANIQVKDDDQEDSNVYYFPPPVFKIECECFKGNWKILWSFPFNLSSEVNFSLATDTGVSVTLDKNFYLLKTESYLSYDIGSRENLCRPISVWIKTIEGYKESVDSYHFCT